MAPMPHPFPEPFDAYAEDGRREARRFGTGMIVSTAFVVGLFLGAAGVLAVQDWLGVDEPPPAPTPTLGLRWPKPPRVLLGATGIWFQEELSDGRP